MVLFWGSKVKFTRRINAYTVNAQYILKYKLGTQTEHEDRISEKCRDLQGQRVKVTRSRDVSDRCWPISRERNVLETPKLVGRLPTPPTTMPTSFKVTWSITLHNNTLFQTTIAFYSHSLGGDTSTITLPPL